MSANTDSKQFLEIMSNFLLDERFQLVAGLCKERNWLDVQRLVESNMSDLLLWLLDPRQGHGLGDYFIRRLLIGAMSAEDPSERMVKWIDEKAWPSIDELDQMSFSNTFVAREVATSSNQVKNGRIDLLVVDPVNSLLIMIERKDGSKLQEGQLDTYQNWANDSYPDYRHLWLVLDSYDLGHENINDDWLQLNDDWLISGLSNVIDREQLPDQINRQLKEIRLLLSGEYAGHEDPYYRDLDETLEILAKSRKKELRIIQDLTISVGQHTHKFVDVDEKAALSILPRLGANRRKPNTADSDLLKAVVLAVRYHWVLYHLLSRNRLTALKQEIEAHHDYRDRFIFETERDRRGTDRLSISLKRFEILDKWPFWIAIEVSDGQGDESDSSADEQFARLVFDTECAPGSAIPDEIWPRLADKYKAQKNRQGQRWIRSKRECIEEISLEAVKVRLDELLAIEAEIRAKEKQGTRISSQTRHVNGRLRVRNRRLSD